MTSITKALISMYQLKQALLVPSYIYLYNINYVNNKLIIPLLHIRVNGRCKLPHEGFAGSMKRLSIE